MMPPDKQPTERIPCYCALCRSRCGAIAERQDGRFLEQWEGPDVFDLLQKLGGQ